MQEPRVIVTDPSTWTPRNCSQLSSRQSVESTESRKSGDSNSSYSLPFRESQHFYFFFFFFETMSHISYTQIYYTVKDDREFLIFLSLVPKYWDVCHHIQFMQY